MNRTLIAALVATSTVLGLAGSASAATLLYGSDANDHKSVQVVNVPAADEGGYVAITSSRGNEAALPASQGNGKQLLILPDSRTDGTQRVFY